MKFRFDLCRETAKTLLVRENTIIGLGLPNGRPVVSEYYKDLMSTLDQEVDKNEVVLKAKDITTGPSLEVRRSRSDACAVFVTAVKKGQFLTDEIFSKAAALDKLQYFASLDKSMDLSRISWENLPDEVSLSVLVDAARGPRRGHVIGSV